MFDVQSQLPIQATLRETKKTKSDVNSVKYYSPKVDNNLLWSTHRAPDPRQHSPRSQSMAAVPRTPAAPTPPTSRGNEAECITKSKFENAIPSCHDRTRNAHSTGKRPSKLSRGPSLYM